MVEHAPHDLLRDVAVDQPVPEGMAPLVRGQVHRLAVFVADVAGGQPALQRHPVGVADDRVGAVDVFCRPREQAGCAGRPALGDAVTMLRDQLAQLVVDRHERVAFHLVVVVAQIRGALGVGDDAVGAQPQRVGDAQPTAHQDDRDQPMGGVGEAGEVVGVLELGHDVFGQRPRQPLFAFRVVLGEEHRVGGKRGVPTMLADSGEEPVEQADVAAATLGADPLAAQVGQVAFEQRPVDPIDLGDADVGEEPGEAGDHDDRSAAAGFQPQPAGQSPTDPAFGQLAQPRLGYAVEAQGAVAVVAEAAHPPDIAREFGFPADRARPGRRSRGRRSRAGVSRVSLIVNTGFAHSRCLHHGRARSPQPGGRAPAPHA